MYTHTEFVYLYRFVLANIGGICRRKVLLEYFDQDTSDLVCTGHCCDVCVATTEEKDMQDEMKAVVQGVQSLTNKGEKKVRAITDSICCTP